MSFSAAPELMNPPTEASVRYITSVVRTLKEFYPIRDEWESLLSEAQDHSMNLAFDWLTAWLEIFPPGRLFIVLVRDAQDHRLIGAAPLHINRKRSGFFRHLIRSVQFIGTEPDVYESMKIICSPGYPAEEIVDQVARQLLRAKTCWDMLELNYCSEIEQLRMLQLFFSKNPIPKRTGPEKAGPEKTDMVEIEETMCIPSFMLPDSIKAYEKSLKRKLRYSLSTAQKRVAENYTDQEIEFDTHPHCQESRCSFMAEFFRHHTDALLEKKIRTVGYKFPRLLEFYQTVHTRFARSTYHKQREAWITCLKIDQQPYSYLMGWHTGEQMMTHMTSYSESFKSYNPGLYNFDQLIREAIHHGIKRFSFGRGEYPYKFLWANERIPLWNFRLFRTRQSRLLWNLDKRLLDLRSCLNSSLTERRYKTND